MGQAKDKKTQWEYEQMAKKQIRSTLLPRTFKAISAFVLAIPILIFLVTKECFQKNKHLWEIK